MKTLSSEEIAKQNKRLELWQITGVPTRHGLKFRQRELFGQHQQWQDAAAKTSAIIMNGESVALLGDRGTGKTQLAVELIRDFCRQFMSCRYVRAREIGMHLREAYGGASTIREAEAVMKFVKPRLLVIDEFQEKPDTEWENRTLSLIFDLRYGSMLPTMLVGNCTVSQFKKSVSSSVIDRLKEGGGIIVCDWASFRKKSDE